MLPPEECLVELGIRPPDSKNRLRRFTTPCIALAVPGTLPSTSPRARRWGASFLRWLRRQPPACWIQARTRDDPIRPQVYVEPAAIYRPNAIFELRSQLWSPKDSDIGRVPNHFESCLCSLRSHENPCGKANVHGSQSLRHRGTRNQTVTS